VDFERLDHLLNLTGELVIHKTKLNLLARQVEELAGADELFAELPRAAQLIEKTTAELQEAIMRVRMLPIRHVFQRFTRMVRDLAKQKGKEVTLSFSGEDTEIDKTVIDALGEPLIHLIRNSIDHGIELPGERLQKGKGPAGRIHLSAKQESSHIVISVEDDGGGMNAERIRSKAIEKGLITPDQVLAEDDVYGLVFQPGFSTVDQVTETSGRGVGLDVVRKVIGDFNGIIDVMSRPGLGTEFILKMPLTLAIIPALLVEVSRELYAVPLTAVLESVKVKAAEIHRVDGNEVVQLRGSVLRVKRLSRVLGLQDRDQPHYYMVVLGRAEKKTGLLVDRLRGQQEVVIKALDEYLGDVASFAGATILGDGGVVLIVDTARIIE
jgi:two-component system chemotaxis sensor kinase CheA